MKKTVQDVIREFGGRIIHIPMRKCDDVPRFIRKANAAHKQTAKSTLRFGLLILAITCLPTIAFGQAAAGDVAGSTIVEGTTTGHMRVYVDGSGTTVVGGDGTDIVINPNLDSAGGAVTRITDALRVSGGIDAPTIATTGGITPSGTITGQEITCTTLGVGVTTPLARAHIVQVQATDAFRVDDIAGDSSPFVIKANGKVGVGDPDPNKKIGVLGVDAQISLEESDTEFLRVGVGETGGTSIIGCDDGDELIIGAYSSPTDTSIDPYLTVRASGNVGVATTEPIAKLTVVGTVLGSDLQAVAGIGGATIKATTIALLTDAPEEAIHLNSAVVGVGAQIGNIFAGNHPTLDGYAHMAHKNQKGGAGDYAFMSSSTGHTYFNAPTDKTVTFQINGTKRFQLEADGDVNIDYGTLFVDESANRVMLVGIAPSTILDVKAGSATDPVADAWGVHSLGRYKADVESATRGTTDAVGERVDAAVMKLYNKKALVEPQLKQFKDTGDPSDPYQVDKALDQYNRAHANWVETKTSKKYAKRHLGIVADDPSTPENWKAYGGEDGQELIGLDISAIVMDLVQEIKSLRARVAALEKP